MAKKNWIFNELKKLECGEITDETIIQNEALICNALKEKFNIDFSVGRFKRVVDGGAAKGYYFYLQTYSHNKLMQQRFGFSHKLHAMKNGLVVVFQWLRQHNISI